MYTLYIYIYMYVYCIYSINIYILYILYYLLTILYIYSYIHVRLSTHSLSIYYDEYSVLSQLTISHTCRYTVHSLLTHSYTLYTHTLTHSYSVYIILSLTTMTL